MTSPTPPSFSRHTDYGRLGLDEADLDPDPVRQFRRWLDEAEAAGIYEPNAMVVGTIDPDGSPSSRTVLLKGLDAAGFEFVTNYGSRKGRALAAEPRVTLLFPWYAVQRQVIVFGTAERTTSAVSDAYFANRPRGSQIASSASDQSQPIGSRQQLEERVLAVERRYPDDGAPARPDDWGAFRVMPTQIEFWQGRTSRLHDRLLYTAGPAGWTVERLQP